MVLCAMLVLSICVYSSRDLDSHHEICPNITSYLRRMKVMKFVAVDDTYRIWLFHM